MLAMLTPATALVVLIVLVMLIGIPVAAVALAIVLIRKNQSHQVVCPQCQYGMAARRVSPEGEVACPRCGQVILVASTPEAGRSSAVDTYNIVSDVATGINVRWRDNLLQLAIIVASLLLGILIGALVSADDRATGAVAGGFVGLLTGLFGSGIFLMIYRFVRHILGNHR